MTAPSYTPITNAERVGAIRDEVRLYVDHRGRYCAEINRADYEWLLEIAAPAEKSIDLKHAPTVERWVESPDMFLDGWGGKELPPSFHAYALRLYAAYKKALLLEPTSKFTIDESKNGGVRGGGGSSN